MSSASPQKPLSGARTPRVDTHPPYVSTYGPEAIQLARLAGLELDGWQQDALTTMLAVRDDGKWSCFEFAELVSRQNGKGSILEARALAGLFLLGEHLIMWSAHEYKTAMEAFRRVLTLMGRLGARVSDNLFDVDSIPVKVINTNGEESLERLDTGQRLKFIARSKGSGRGFSGDVNIIDEAFAYTLQQQAALMPTMSARPNPQIIYTSSPPLDGESGDVLYALRARGEAEQPDDSLGWRDWGLAGDLSDLKNIDLNDRANWSATNPALGIRITEETIARERRSMSPVDFARERLGIWPKRIGGEGGVIDARTWAAMTDPESKRAGDVALAIDVTPLRDHASISVYGPRADGLGHVQVVVYGEGTDWIVGKVVEFKEALDPVAIGLDGKGGAAALLDDLEAAGIRAPEDPDMPQRGELLVLNAVDVAAAVGQFIDAARQQTMRHPDQPELATAVAGAKTRPLGDAVGWGRKQSDVDISPLCSATFARYTYLTRVDQIGQSKQVTLTGSLMA